jgi:MFS family permease
MAFLQAAFSLELAVGYIICGLIALIYTFVLNHLRKKGDMNTKVAVFPSPYGGTIEVRKKSSFWITLALIFAILGIIGSLGIAAYGAYIAMSIPELGFSFIAAGVVLLIASAMYAAILNFLRTKLDFPGGRVILRTTGGYFVELYKSRSIWLTIGMIFTILAAIGLIILGIIVFATGATYQQPLTYYGEYEYMVESMYSSFAIFAMALALLVNAAVLNFLRVRGHVRPAQVAAPPPQPVYYQQPPPPPPR